MLSSRPRRRIQPRLCMLTAIAVALGSWTSSEAFAEPPLNTNFDDIKFDIEKDGEFKRSMLTEKIEDLNGKKIKIRGYMLPAFQQDGIKQFVLVRDNMECCFGPGAALYDCILVEMTGSARAKYTTRPVAVEGRFTIQQYKPGKRLLAIYHLDGTSVR